MSFISLGLSIIDILIVFEIRLEIFLNKGRYFVEKYNFSDQLDCAMIEEAIMSYDLDSDFKLTSHIFFLHGNWRL